MCTRGAMRGCEEAQLDTAVPQRAWVSLHVPCAASAQLSLSHTKSEWHPASVEIKVFLAVCSSLANTPPSFFFVLPIYFFSSLILDSIWSAVARRVSCVPVIWSSLTTISFNFWFQSDVFCPLPIYHNFSLVPRGLILSLRNSVLENNATMYPHPQVLCYKPYY